MVKSQIKLGIVLSYFQMALGIIVGLIYTPLMIKGLGQSEYGLYNTVASTISMLSILSLGFNAGYIRYYSRYKNNNDEEEIKRLNGMFLLLFLGIGFVALVCGFFLSSNLEIIFKDGLASNEYAIARKLFLLLTINLSFSFPMSVFSTIISAHERFVVLKSLGIIKTVVSPLLTIPVLLMGYGSVGMVIVTVTISIFVDLLYLFYCLTKLKCKFEFKSFDKALFKDLTVYTSFIAINIIVDQINWNVDKILIARYKGTSSVAVYTVGYTLYSYYQQLSTSISSIFTPKIHFIENTMSEVETKNKKFTDLMISVGRIQLIILGLAITGIVLFGKFFIEDIWAGKEFSQSFYVALLLIIPATIPLIQNVGIEIQRAKNKHQFRSIVYAVMAVMNIVLSIYLCQKFGAIGSALGTAISLIVANGIIMNIYYYKVCGINVLMFWKKISALIFAGIIPCVLWEEVLKYIKVSSLGQFIVYGGLYTVTYIIFIWIVGLNRYEKERINSILKNKNARLLK